MRLWSLHPSLLDYLGLNAVWREGLGAQAILKRLESDEENVGYSNHPQLIRFKDRPEMIGTYLHWIWVEAVRRGYNYNRDLIQYEADPAHRMTVTSGQFYFELGHLIDKLKERDPEWLGQIDWSEPLVHPLFVMVPGSIAEWEKGVQNG